jgi:hypothetical protein
LSGKGVRPDADIRWPRRWLRLFLFTVVVLERFVVPGTPISIAVPAAFLVVAALALRGHVLLDRTRSILYLAAVMSCSAASLIFTISMSLSFSITSLSLLMVVYAPYCVRVSPTTRHLFPDLLELFQRIMVVGATVCLAQFIAQLAGWQFRDLLDFLPPNLLAQDFNTSYPLYYGSPIFKSNGILFLEPSFASQFLALAMIIQLLSGRARRRMLLFAGALLTTFSGTGMILLAVGLLVLAFRAGARWAWRMIITVTVAALVVGITPAADLFVSRAGEISEDGSSGNSRFIAPYEVVFGALSTDLSALLVGRGAGSVSSDVNYFAATGDDANYPAVPKLLGEYGIPASLLFLVFLVTAFFRRVPSTLLGVMVCVLYFFLSGALLEPHIIYLSWILTGLFAADPSESRIRDASVPVS